ncbi:signal recognition particle receptor subunit alpha-like isoform X1 [Amphibalanus amphitrite]|uniref:signal recognition particle receptor subunit alpha-like isoform X1 n=1 Tax=Amphibalanus amphitrite TaxID=1232801 RepID=UPI001C8FF0CF|nr:signal recognition particle receptor subunit alpha-like isoform X1 [Amphibalanus amphitrite]
MLDFFVIFTKGGIVLWCFEGTKDLFAPSVNALVKSVLLQERTGISSFTDASWTLKYRLDNEFDLVFVVGFQKILQLSYVDKLLDDVQREFRDKFENLLTEHSYYQRFSFDSRFAQLQTVAEQWGQQKAEAPRTMRSFEQSQKSQKTVASMIEKKGGDNKENKKPGKDKKKKKGAEEPVAKPAPAPEPEPEPEPEPAPEPGMSQEDQIKANRRKMMMKMSGGGGKKKEPKSPKSPAAGGGGKKGKEARIWALSGGQKDAASLDFSEAGDGKASKRPEFVPDTSMVGAMAGNIQDMEVDEESEPEEQQSAAPTKQKSGGVFGMFKSLVGSKTITKENVTPVLNQLKDHLVGKNVAADIAAKLCDSIALKLEGKVLGTFEGVAQTVRQTLVDSLVQILSPKRRIDILRDVMTAKQSGRPYVVAFCGVNGVGKSTNLAKICFWLIENGFSVLIAACDTFRAGAVEQLRTHTRHLNALHPPEKHGGRQMVQLYEKGYGKDPAGIANDAIGFARESRVDVVLIDTAGRMQDNEPLMRALGKLIKVNEPDLVLFVGEALVGNEAVDQLVKFNQSLADHSASDRPHTIDGIVLTKFDTIDDKVGAAISMTYVTGQPIVFVGCGQTYTDLRNLNARAVVTSLMK